MQEHVASDAFDFREHNHHSSSVMPYTVLSERARPVSALSTFNLLTELGYEMDKDALFPYAKCALPDHQF